MLLRSRTVAWRVSLILLVSGVVLGGIAGASFAILGTNYFKRQAELALSERLGLQVTIGDLSFSLRPQPRLFGRQLVARDSKAAVDAPFIVIDRFSAGLGPLSVWRRHVSTLDVEGLRILVPPGRTGVEPRTPGLDRPTASDTESLSSTSRSSSMDLGRVVVDHLEAREAQLTVLRREPGKDPLVFRIHRLTVKSVGFDRVMSFSTELTNPVPEGLVQSTGTLGPWNPTHPSELPISGIYTFSLANLGTLPGVGGMLTSVGRYEGELTQITVTGETTTPDFRLGLGGRPVPLETTFRAIVNGSDGTTVLERVDARLFNTPIAVQGRIENLPGPGRRNIELGASIAKGRIEDVLRLVSDAPPALTGDIAFKGRVSLPPGRTVVRDRLHVKGSFDLDRARFVDPSVRVKLVELSRRSRGLRKESAASSIPTHLAGEFSLERGTIALRRVEFDVPGARVNLEGTYALGTNQLDLAGTLRMQATVSQAVGGVRSVFLKPFDWIFRKDGAGAVVPIEIGGTPKQPAVGVSLSHVLRPRKEK